MDETMNDSSSPTSLSERQVGRRALIGGAALAGGLLAAGSAAAQGGAPAPAAFEPKPLPFAAGSIPGFSEKLLTSHHENNYVGAVKRLGAIESAIASLNPSTAPGFTLNGLKREELIAWNSMILHELYFANLGAAATPSPKLQAALDAGFGGLRAWAAQFSAMGKALGGGSGWVMYEHAYAIDYGAKAAAYVDAFMSAINWKMANGRFERV